MAKPARGFGNVNTGKKSESGPRIEELFDLLPLTKSLKKKWITGRLIGGVYAQAVRWIDIETSDKTISIPKVALNYDPTTDSYDSTIEDPYEDIPNPQRITKSYYVNFIVRDHQDDKPRRTGKPTPSEKKSGFKEKDSDCWTPVMAVRVPISLAGKFQELVELNTVRKAGKVKTYELSDPKFGCDIAIKYDPDKDGTDKYSVQKQERTPLSKEEQNYLIWDLSKIPGPESFEQAEREAKALAAKSPILEEEDDEEDDDLPIRSKKKSSRRASSKKKSVKDKKVKLKKDKKKPSSKVKSKRTRK